MGRCPVDQSGFQRPGPPAPSDDETVPFGAVRDKGFLDNFRTGLTGAGKGAGDGVGDRDLGPMDRGCGQIVEFDGGDTFTEINRNFHGVSSSPNSVSLRQQ